MAGFERVVHGEPPASFCVDAQQFCSGQGPSESMKRSAEIRLWSNFVVIGALLALGTTLAPPAVVDTFGLDRSVRDSRPA
jgi:hypothetical protein